MSCMSTQNILSKTEQRAHSLPPRFIYRYLYLDLTVPWVYIQHVHLMEYKHVHPSSYTAYTYECLYEYLCTEHPLDADNARDPGVNNTIQYGYAIHA